MNLMGERSNDAAAQNLSSYVELTVINVVDGGRYS